MAVPLVSAVIPARNVAAWIGETVTSVAGQTYPKDALELIVVDDGSTDDTIPVATLALRDSGLHHRFLTVRTSEGPGAARNRGWREARGAWVQFLDSDDLLSPEKIATQVSVAVGLPEDVAVVTSRWGRLRCRDGVWCQDSETVDPVIGVDAMADLIDPERFVHIDSCLIRRSWLDRVGGFQEAFRLVEDVDLLLRIAAAGGRFERAHASSALAWYRQRPGSVSREDDRALVDACVRNARFVERASGLAPSPARARAISRVYFQAARFFRPLDRPRFDELSAGIYRVSPDFVPPGPPALRYLTRVIGYARAETLAVGYRRWRGLSRLLRRV